LLMQFSCRHLLLKPHTSIPTMNTESQVKAIFSNTANLSSTE
jgi:hypothetical protein